LSVLVLQAHALMVQQQQQLPHMGLQDGAAPALPCSRASAVLPGNSLLVHPQPLLEVAALESEQEQSS
jgi:hypothetical protein